MPGLVTTVTRKLDDQLEDLRIKVLHRTRAAAFSSR